MKIKGDKYVLELIDKKIKLQDNTKYTKVGKFIDVENDEKYELYITNAGGSDNLQGLLLAKPGYDQHVYFVANRPFKKTIFKNGKELLDAYRETLVISQLRNIITAAKTAVDTLIPNLILNAFKLLDKNFLVFIADALYEGLKIEINNRKKDNRVAVKLAEALKGLIHNEKYRKLLNNKSEKSEFYIVSSSTSEFGFTDILSKITFVELENGKGFYIIKQLNVPAGTFDDKTKVWIKGKKEKLRILEKDEVSKKLKNAKVVKRKTKVLLDEELQPLNLKHQKKIFIHSSELLDDDFEKLLPFFIQEKFLTKSINEARKTFDIIESKINKLSC